MKHQSKFSKRKEETLISKTVCFETPRKPLSSCLNIPPPAPKKRNRESQWYQDNGKNDDLGSIYFPSLDSSEPFFIGRKRPTLIGRRDTEDIQLKPRISDNNSFASELSWRVSFDNLRPSYPFFPDLESEATEDDASETSCLYPLVRRSSYGNFDF